MLLFTAGALSVLTTAAWEGARTALRKKGVKVQDHSPFGWGRSKTLNVDRHNLAQAIQAETNEAEAQKLVAIQDRLNKSWKLQLLTYCVYAATAYAFLSA